MSNWKPDGWHIDGRSWRCPTCGAIIGSNLRGERPFWFVSKHREASCEPVENAAQA